MKISRHLKLLYLIFTTAIITVSCAKHDTDFATLKTGEIQIEITDAPIDNNEVRSAYITLSALELEDTNLLNEKISIDLLAYQQGNTKNLGTYALPAKSYDHLKVVLDLQEDAFGNIPGCFVSTQQGKKHNLYPSNSLTKTLIIPLIDFHINENSRMNMIIDFDLRKLIRLGKNETEIKYQFVDDRSMEDGIRVLNKDLTGSIKGVFNNETGLSSIKMIAFIYKSGTFNKIREIRNQETHNPDFSSAVNSSRVDENGNFYLPFLSKGSYELVFAGFDNTPQNEFMGILNALSTTGTNLQEIYVENGNVLNIQGSIVEVLPN